MPRVELPALLQKLEEPPESLAIFLYGEEEYLREEALQRTLRSLLDPATRDFNFDQLRGSEATPESLGSLLSTPPMMAARRVIVVRDAQGLSPKSRDAVQDALANPTPGVVLVVLATIPARSKAKFYDILMRGSIAVEFPGVDALDLPAFIVERAARVHQVRVEMDAARALAAAIGAQVGPLTTELDKAVSYAGDRSTITLEDVKAVGGYIPRVDRWGWFDKIGERRFGEALAELPELLDSGESGVGLVIGIGSHLLKLGLLVAGGRQGLERHLPPRQQWLVNRLQRQAGGWTPKMVDRSLRELLRTDRLLKSASLSDRQLIEELILRISHDID
ncbi:MAG: DNA polymerase III subunit delta [Gemmatimonadota bacterium]